MDVDIVIIIISIVLTAFFSGLEIAFVSANKLQIALEKKKGGLTAFVLTRLTDKSSKFITTMLVGNNVFLVIYSYYMGAKIVSFLPQSWNEFTILIIQTLLSTIIILVTAELLPKAIFRVYANESLTFLAIPTYFFYVIFNVISSLMTMISNIILKVFFNQTYNEEVNEFSKEELGYFIDKQLETTDDDDDIDSEIQIFQNALVFNTVKSREIMIPRTDIRAVELHESIENLTQIFIKTGLSKIIVYKTSLDDIVGYVHAYEMFKNPKTIKSILLPVEFIPESMMVNDVLGSMMKKHKSIAVVIDEYGGTSGIVTVEDIVEELFGEIEDEHDKIKLTEVKINELEYKFSARLEVDYLNEIYDLEIPKDESYETLGGYILENLEDIPSMGQEIYMHSFYIKILNVSSSKIEEVYLKRIQGEE